MSQVPKQKIAILGGGIAALTTAHELSKSSELRQRFDITVYQMGWRLGGKLASGRQQDDHDRNVEHGLHVWFGFYENAFALYKEIFSLWAKPKGCPFQTWKDAFTPENYTPIGETIDGKLTYWAFEWPANCDEPGDGKVLLSPMGVITEILNFVKNLLTEFDDIWEQSLWKEIPKWIDGIFSKKQFTFPAGQSLKGLFHRIELLLSRFDEDQISDDDIKAMIEIFDLMNEQVRQKTSGGVDSHRLRNFVDIGLAVLRGFFNPEDGIYKDWNLDRVNDLDFREWLIKNGANKDIVNQWTVVRAIYDAWFEYVDGDTNTPSFCAGTALRVIIRIAMTYKGSVLYHVNSGMGETVIAPIYQVLKDHGVKFKFFHRIEELKLSPNKKYVNEIIMSQQAKPKGEYNPVYEVKGLVCWPAEPFWDQLEDGDEMRKQGIDFESKWSKNPFAMKIRLKEGLDFDRVVLAISLGAFKRLNHEPSMCQEIIDSNDRFKAMTENLGLVPSIGIQFWMKPNLEQLGFQGPPPAMVSWSYPNDVWADMTQVLATENWTYPNVPGSLHYLCGTIGTDLYKNPSTDHTTMAKALELGRAQTIQQFQTTTYSIWPKATVDGEQGFDWNLLVAPADKQGVERLNYQWIRVNVEPTECCVGSPKDSFKYRLACNESGIVNLFFAGAWLRTGLDSSCVEAAVMSGLQSARAVGDLKIDIVGERFMAGEL